MRQEEIYNGHKIVVETTRRGNGWVATYQIDGGEIRRCGDRPLLNEGLVLFEAIGDAKVVIDQMK